LKLPSQTGVLERAQKVFYFNKKNIMIEIRKKNVVIPLATWNELKKIDYFKEIIEVLEDSELLEKTKKESKGFISLDEYIIERDQKEYGNSKAPRKNLKTKKLIV
jgi:hypothetical protein